MPEHVKQKIQILFDRLFDRLPSSVSYKWNEAIKPQLNQVLDSNKFDSCLQLCQQDINSVLQYYLNQSTIDSGSDQLKSFRDVLNETIKHSNDILSFINQFAIDSLSFDQLFSQIFNESLVSNF